MQPAAQAVLDRLHARMEEERDLWQRLPEDERDARLDEFMLAVGEDAGRFLHLLARATGCRTILELGTSVGYSTLWLADAARGNGGRVITVDVNPDKTAQARDYLTDAGLAERVELHTGDAVAACRELPGPFDLVLLDTWKDLYIPSFEAFRGKLDPGGLIAADNIVHPDSPNTRAYQQRVRADAALESVLVPIGNGIELSRMARSPADNTQADAALQGVLERLHTRMAEEDRLRATLPPEAFAAKRPELMLAIGAETGRFLNLLARSASARRVLEIGTSVGYSTLWLAHAARETGGTVVSVDGSPAKHEQARANLAAARLSAPVELVTGQAPAVLERLEGPFDLLLLDCERHDYRACLDAVAPRLAAGALVVADNMTFPHSPHAPEYQAHVRGLPGWESLLVPIGNGIELSRTSD